MGAKGKNLEILSRHGIAVPRGFLLGADSYLRAVSPHFADIVRALPDESSISEIIMGASIPEVVLEEIERGLADITGANRFAVRSSGTVVTGSAVTLTEDNDDLSLAGQFESYLNVPRELVPHAVKQCWASLFNQRSVDGFSANTTYVEGSSMGVVIQEMITAKSSAVMMTVDPLGTGSTGAIEFTWGPCEAIVAGITSPDDAIFDRVTGALLKVNIGPKRHRISYSDYPGKAGNSFRTNVSLPDCSRLSLSADKLEEAVQLGFAIEQIFRAPQDIELVVDAQGRFVITQSRPVTTLPANLAPFSLPNDQLMKGKRS